MNTIIRNDINDSKNISHILMFLNMFKAKKCLFCFSHKPFHEEENENEENNLCKCKCGYYFCNKTLKKSTHIYRHLKECKHSEISLTPFETPLHCMNCGKKNIFELFFEKNDKNQIFCENCKNEEEEYIQIVDNKMINPEILFADNIAPLANRPDCFTEFIIAKLNRKISQLTELKADKYKHYHTQINYSNKDIYYKIFKSLINDEIKAVQEENIYANQVEQEFELKFYTLEGTYIMATIIDNHKSFSFYRSQVLKVQLKHEQEDEELEEETYGKEKRANVIDIQFINDSDVEITLFFRAEKKELKNGKYKIKEVQSIVSYERILEGLDRFKKYDNLCDENIVSLILANNKNVSNENTYIQKEKIPKDLNIHLEDGYNLILNNEQTEAVQNCLRNKLTLVPAPPGTGKTTLVSALAYILEKLLRFDTDKILICARDNIAVENISLALRKLKLDFVRVFSAEKEIDETEDHYNSLNKLVKNLIEQNLSNPINLKMKRILDIKEKIVHLIGEDYEYYKKYIHDFERRILDTKKIVLTTTNNACDKRLKDEKFPIVIMDEATQALEPECLLPLIKGAKMVVLIGDEKQLGPTVFSKECQMCGLSTSLFERLITYYNGSSFISKLKEQFRMNPFLYRFPNEHFYENKIVSNVNNNNIQNNAQIMNIFPKKDIPAMFYHVEGREKFMNHSYFNMEEVDTVFYFVKELIQSGVNNDQIGIITPYNAQKYKLMNLLCQNNIRIESVDGFQGMEKDYIIITAVRSNFKGQLGFVSDEKRLNVALTRPRKGLILIGNHRCLIKRASIWRDLIHFYDDNEILVQGNINDLQRVRIDEDDKDDEVEIFEGKIEKNMKYNIKNNQNAAPNLENQLKEEKKEKRKEPTDIDLSYNQKVKEKEIKSSKKNKNKRKKNKNEEEDKKEEEKKDKEEEEKKKGNKKYKNKMNNKKNKKQDEKHENNEDKKDNKEKKEKNVKEDKNAKNKNKKKQKEKAGKKH